MTAWELRERQQILCGILHTENVTMPWAFGLRNLIMPGEFRPVAGMPYDHARNAVCQEVLNGPWEYCLRPECLVETVGGPKQIRKLVVGDYVRSHRGMFRKVTRVFKREVKQGTPLIMAHSANSHIRCTPEHPFFVWRNGNLCLIRAECLEATDCFVYPDKPKADWLNFDIRFNTTGVNGDGKLKSVKNGSCLGNVPVTRELARFMGLYLAEGCGSHDGICFTFNNNETEYIDVVRRVAKTMFDRKPSITARWATNVKINVRPLSNLFRSWFGKTATVKRIPAFVFEWSLENRLQFLRGYLDGDGSVARKTSVCFRTASKELADGVASLGASCGLLVSYTPVKASVAVYQGAEIRSKGSYQGRFSTRSTGKFLDLLDATREGDYLLIPVTKVESKGMSTGAKDSNVYNLEVEGDNSFISDFAAVHNCGFLDSDVIPPRDAFPRLIAHNQPIVSAVYARRSPPHSIPVMLRRHSPHTPPAWVQPNELPKSGLLEVDLVGAGCMVIHRSVLEKLPPLEPGHPWFCWRVDRQGILPPGECLSEDFSFNRHCAKNGIKTLVDCSIRCKHVGNAESDVGTFVPAEVRVHT